MWVVVRYRDGWWMAYLEGCGVEFALDKSFSVLMRQLHAGGYRIRGVEARPASGGADNPLTLIGG